MCTKRQVATLEQQKRTATGLGGSLGQCEGHGRDKAGSTPPVVPGAAPALAKAGVGGYSNLFIVGKPFSTNIPYFMRSEIGVWLSWLTWQNRNPARKNSPAYKAAQAKLKQAVGSPVDLPRCPECVQSGGVFELSF